MHGILSRGIRVSALGRSRDRLQALGQHAPLLTFLGLLVVAGYLAANLTGEFMRPSSLAALPSAGPKAREVRAKPDNLSKVIAAAHLFGAPSSSPKAALTNAPETHLDLTLVGIAAGTKSNSRAIIASGTSRIEKTYAVGSSLPDGAVIRAILAQQVVLNHNGRLEALRLPNPGTSILATHMTFSSTPAGHASASLEEKQNHERQLTQPAQISAVRTRIESNPHLAYRYIRMQRYAPKGKLKGFRVYPGKYPALFEQSGLSPGEIVTAIGGIALSNPLNLGKALNKLRDSQGTITLRVIKNGHPSTVTVNTGD